MPLVLGGSGDGKSRLLTEIPAILQAPDFFKGKEEEDQTLAQALQGAYVFMLGFENGTKGSLDGERLKGLPAARIAVRMVHQLLPDYEFDDLVALCPPNLTPKKVLRRLAQVEGKNLNHMSFIFCVDGVQAAGAKTFREQRADDASPMRGVIASLSMLSQNSGNQREPFCFVTAAALSDDIKKVPDDPGTRKVALSLTRLDPKKIFDLSPVNNDPCLSLLIGDMGGHPRALEMLFDTLRRETESLDTTVHPEVDTFTTNQPEVGLRRLTVNAVHPGWSMVNSLTFVSTLLRQKYHTNLAQYKPLLQAVLLGHRFIGEKTLAKFDAPDLYVDDVLATGLFQQDDNGRLHAPPIFLYAALHDKPHYKDLIGPLYDFYQLELDVDAEFPTAEAYARWFEKFTVHHWALKTRIFAGETKVWTDLHYGARFHPDYEKKSETITVEPVKRVVIVHETYETKSSSRPHQVTQAMTGEEVVLSPSVFVVSANNTSGGDSFGLVQLSANNQVTFAMSNKLRRRRKDRGKYAVARLSKKTYDAEYTKACAKETDFFMEYSTAAYGTLADSDLPPRAGLVDYNTFETYFGPVASRLLQALTNAPASQGFKK
eukprot:m.167043 g.167043  ORF g.167043 m.167043 type:complete len:600 (+) comp25032_c0_seq1:780-2579(+)